MLADGGDTGPLRAAEASGRGPFATLMWRRRARALAGFLCLAPERATIRL